jgi:large subunit ribosomal protein L34
LLPLLPKATGHVFENTGVWDVAKGYGDLLCRALTNRKLVRKRRHGFRSRMATVIGRNVIARRRAGRGALGLILATVEHLKRRQDFVAAARRRQRPTVAVGRKRRPAGFKPALGLPPAARKGSAMRLPATVPSAGCVKQPALL